MSDQHPQINPRIILAVFLLLFSLAGCATVRTQIHDPKFVSENHPVRELRILVASDGSYDRGRIDSLIAEVSRSLVEQAGIRLKPIKYIDIKWEKRGPKPMLQSLYEKTSSYDADTDLIIGFTSKSPLDLVTNTLIGGWQAVIDDTFRRYIVLNGLDAHSLAHELCHAFILSHTHGDTGLMRSASVQIVAGVPILQSNYLSVEDRREVIKNKWRDFSEMQELNLTEQEHPLNLTSPNPFKDVSK